MPFFSVVLPTYNRAAELKASVQSVLDQTFTDLEIVVVDDGSTDDTRDVVAAIGDAKIKYIYQQNQERSAARNNGIEHATGKYICLLDSGDIYYPEHLATLHQQIVNDGEPVAVYKTMMHYSDRSRPDDLSYAYKGNDRESAIRYVWINGSQLISLCFHQSIGKTIKFAPEFFWFEDIHWLMRVVMQYPLKQVPAHTTRYNMADSSVLLKANFKKYLDNCEACIRDLERQCGTELKKVLGNNCFNERIAGLYLGFVVRGAIMTKQFSLAGAYLAKAMRTSMSPKLAVKYIYYYLKLLKARATG